MNEEQEIKSALSTFDDTHQCYRCKHFDFNPGEPGWYSELTPGSDMSLSCLANHWPVISNMSSSRDEVQSAFEHGPSCPDWESDV